MESFQKRARERRRRERQAEKQARRRERSAAKHAESSVGARVDPATNRLLPAIPSTDNAPANAPDSPNPSS